VSEITDPKHLVHVTVVYKVIRKRKADIMMVRFSDTYTHFECDKIFFFFFFKVPIAEMKMERWQKKVKGIVNARVFLDNDTKYQKHISSLSHQPRRHCRRKFRNTTSAATASTSTATSTATHTTPHATTAAVIAAAAADFSKTCPSTTTILRLRRHLGFHRCRRCRRSRRGHDNRRRQRVVVFVVAVAVVVLVDGRIRDDSFERLKFQAEIPHLIF
jgi:hypothetical protein